MAEEYEKTTRFAGVNPEVPAVAAKAKNRLVARKEREKEIAALAKKKKAALKAASAKARAGRSA